MKSIFDSVSYSCSKLVTESYSTSFTLATKMLGSSIRRDIYNIYGFVRFADEIVDSFHDFDKESLFNAFEEDLKLAIKNKISLNPILNSFQDTYHKYEIPYHLVDSFMKSMRMDLTKSAYKTNEEYKAYIYGSADVVGLMCLKVFVNGDDTRYNELKTTAMALGSAFQNKIVEEIRADFKLGYSGILLLPNEAKFGVYTAYKYYSKLLHKLEKTPSLEIKNTRIRVPNYQKFGLLAKSYMNYKLQLV